MSYQYQHPLLIPTISYLSPYTPPLVWIGTSTRVVLVGGDGGLTLGIHRYIGSIWYQWLEVNRTIVYMVTGEILLGIPYYWYYRHYTTPTRYYTTSLYKYTLLLDRYLPREGKVGHPQYQRVYRGSRGQQWIESMKPTVHILSIPTVHSYTHQYYQELPHPFQVVHPGQQQVLVGYRYSIEGIDRWMQ